MRVRRLAVEHYGKLTHLPLTQFLHIDTDSDLKWEGSSEVEDENITFGIQERLDLSRRWREYVGSDTNSVRNNPAIESWLPPGCPIAQDLHEGTGGLRPAGRLAFQYGVNDFRSGLRAAISRALDPAAIAAFQPESGLAIPHSVSVLLVCSLMGGTGGGSFLEAAYNIRQVLQTLEADLCKGELVGFLIIGTSAMSQANKANCYSALKELEYYSGGSICGGRMPFKAVYPVPGRPSLVAKDRPFTTCYLLNHINSAGVPFPGGSLTEKVARNVFVEITPGLAAHKRIRRVSPARVRTIPIDGRRQRFQGFATLGLSALEFPAVRVQDMLAYHLASHAARAWLRRNAPATDDLDKRVDAVIEQFGLSRDDSRAAGRLCGFITDMVNDPSQGPRSGLRLIEKLIERLSPAGGNDNCLMKELPSLQRRIEQYSYYLRAAAERFAREHDRLREKLLTEPIAAGMHITRERLAELELQIIPDLEQECHTLLQGVRDAETGFLFPALADRFEQTCKSIFAQAQARCAGARRLSIAQELERAHDLTSIVASTIVQGAPLLRLRGPDESQTCGNRHRWIATADFERDPHTRHIVDAVKRSAPDVLEAPVLADPSSILYAEEVLLFPLSSIQFLSEYRFCYQALEHHGLARQTDRRVEFPDLLPPPVNEPAIRRRAQMHYVLGRVFGFLREQGNGQTGTREIALTYLTSEGERMQSRIANRWGRVEQSLGERQEYKERCGKAYETPLEILERLVADQGRRARYHEQREFLWRRTQEYLNQLKTELDGGESNPEYRRQLEFIADFWGDRQLLSGGPYASYNEAAYGRLLRIALTVSPNPDAAERARKIQNGMVLMGLAEQQAERIFDEQQAAIRSAGILEYREAAEMVSTFGRVTESARDGLLNLQKEYGLTAEEAHAVEFPFFAPLYRREVERALALSGSEACFNLRHLQQLLGLTDAEAGEIEEQVRGSKSE